ncbi:MAG: hypothetical protein IJZ32_00280 [Clostridia bacterium]|nr:hypothetical protein [Clostridia bacterium]
MKKLKRILVSGLSLFFALSAVACSGNGNDGENSSEQETVKTNEEIFADVKAADANSRAYEGAYTIEQKNTEIRYTIEQPNMEIQPGRVKKIEMISSGDKTNRKFVEKAYEIDENGEKQPYHEAKWFQNEGKDCWYYNDYEEHTYCYEDMEAHGLDIVLSGMPSEALDSLVSFTLADSFAELTQAYQTVTENSVQALKADYPVASGATSVTAEDVNGISVVRIDSQAEICKNDQTPASYASSFFLAAKGGRIYKIYMKTDMSWELQGVPVRECQEYEFVYRYDFNEGLYNSVIPCEIEELPQTQKGMIEIEFVYHDDFSTRAQLSLRETATAQTLFAEAESQAFPYGEAYTVEGWYLDEACTQRLDVEAIDAEALLEIEKLYAKDFTVADDWAVIAMRGKTENRLSKQCKIVEGNGFHSTALRDGNYYPRFLPVDRINYTWNIGYYADDYDEIYFEGELTTAESVTLEGGRLYTAKFVDIYEDKDYNLFGDLYNI